MPLSSDITDVLDAVLESRLGDVHTAIPGRVKSYDPATQTAEVVPQVRVTAPKEDGSTAAEELPVLPNVPVQWPRGGGYALHFPLEPGDFVLLVFSEAAIGHWRETGQLADPGDLERHSIGYPFAIPGIAPNAGVIADAPEGEAVLTVPPGKVLRVGGELAELVALASKVETELQRIATAFATFVPGSGGASFPDAYTAPASVAATKLKAE